MAMTAWSAKVCRRAISSSVNAGFAAGYQDGPHRVGVAQYRDNNPASVAMKTCRDARPLRHAGIDFVVDDIERCAVAYRLRVDTLGLKGLRVMRPDTGLRSLVGGFEGDEFRLISSDASEENQYPP